MIHRLITFKLLLFLLNFPVLTAQNISVSGKVYDQKTGEALPGAHVSAGDKGTVTDINGSYELLLKEGEYSITASFTGYKIYSEKIVINSNRTFNIRLIPEQKLLEQVVVTSSKYEQKISEVTVSMEVLKPDFIENYSPKSIDEVLERVPGVTIIDGQPNIRGGSGYSYGAGSRVQILLNGMPILSGDAGFPAWSFFPMEILEQVEIIKGASSALYGSSALNGIINLRTKTPLAKPQTLVKFYSGIYDKPEDNVTDQLDYLEFNIKNGDTISVDSIFKEKAWWDGNNPFFTGASVYHLRKIGNLDLMAGVDLFAENSFLKDDYTRRGKFSWGTTYKHIKNGRLLTFEFDGNLMFSNSSSFFLWAGDESLRYLPLENTITNTRSYKLNIDPSITYIDKKQNKHKLQGRYFKNDNVTDRDQSTLSDLIYGEYQFQKKISSKELIFSAGVTGTYTHVDAELYGDTSHNSKNGSVYIQLDKHFFDRLNISLGARYETFKINNESSESWPVVRAGANYKVANYTFLRASFGQGYRFPTIAEKFIRTNVGIIQVFPNPDLNAETGWSAEVGLKQGFGTKGLRGFADIALFWTEYRDMMEFSFGGTTGQLFGFQSVNIGATEIKGIETAITGEAAFNSLTIGTLIGYTYISPEYKNFDSITQVFSSADYNVLKYRFNHTGNANLEIRYKILNLAVSGSYYSNMEAIDKVFEVFIPGIATYRSENNNGELILNAQAGVQINSNINLSLSCRNLLNNEYSLRPGLMEAPRNFAVTFSGKF